jgi:hypothetical protein
MNAAVKDAQNVTWKYILFDHNDSEEEILKAQELSEEFGVSHLLFILTNSKGKSKRFSTANIAEFPLLSERASVSPAAALKRSIATNIKYAQSGHLSSADAPHFHIDRCYLIHGGLLTLEGWACERNGQPLHKIVVRVDGKESGVMYTGQKRTDVIAAFDFPNTIRPGFLKWATVQRRGSDTVIEFALHSVTGIQTLTYTFCT